VGIPVTLGLQLGGAEAVKSGLRGVKQSFVEMERETLAATKESSKQRIALLRDESKQKIALLREESKARREVMQAEASFKRAVNRKESEYGLGAAGNALVKGEGVGGILKAAGIAGIAVGAFTAAINFASSSLRQFSSFVIADVIKPMLALGTRSQQVANNSGGALSAADVRGRARAIGLRNNMDPMGLIEAAGRFQDLTGEPAMGFDVLGTVATISKGRGYDPKALSELAAAMYRPGQKAGDLNQLLLTLTGQGEKGSIPIGELARLGGRLTAPAAKFGGDAFTQITTGNALLQTAKRTGFGTVDEAATAYGKFVEESFLHGKLASPSSFARINGVERLTDPVHYLGNIFRKTQGDATKIHAMGFSEETQKFVGAYTSTYSDAYAKAKGAGEKEPAAREDAAKAVEEFVNSMAKQTSTMSAEGERRDAVMATDGEKFAKGLEIIKSIIAKAIGGDVESFADAFLAHAEEIGHAGALLAGAFMSVASLLLDIANVVAGRFSKTGDVVRTVLDRGKDTRLPAVRDSEVIGGQAIPGYWRKGEGVYEYVKGSGSGGDTKNLPGVSRRVGPNGDMVLFPGEQEPVSPSQLASYLNPPAPNASQEGDGTNMTSAAGDEQEAAQTAADAHEELASNADALSDSLCKLGTCVDQLSSQMDSLNRSQPFTTRR
jgi:hypothetical protein